MLRRLRAAVGGYERWAPGSNLPGCDRMPHGQWRIHCGPERYTPEGRAGACVPGGDPVLNFQVGGTGSGVERFEIGLFWGTGWALMFHRDPDREAPPLHPLHHVQFEAPAEPACRPPFLAWRLPFGSTDPVEIVAYLVATVSA